MPQSTLTTSNSSSLKNNLQPPYKLLFFSFLLFIQLQLLILTLYTKTFFQLFLVTQLLQNTSLQMANGLQTPTVFFVLITESIYHLLVISVHIFSSIIMIIFLLATSVRIKYWNLFTIDIPGPASILMYNNSTSPVSFICNLNYNITNLINLLNNSLFLNNYGIPFLQTSSRNSYYSLGLTLSWSLLTGLLSRQFLSLPMILSHL